MRLEWEDADHNSYSEIDVNGGDRNEYTIKVEGSIGDNGNEGRMDVLKSRNQTLVRPTFLLFHIISHH